MGRLAKAVKWAVAVLGIIVVGAAGWLYAFPPDLIRVGSGYAAKIVCSNHFIAGRDAANVLEVDVQSPGHPLLRLLNVTVDEDGGTVRAALLGIFGASVAVHREGLGCTSVPDGDVAAVRALPGLPAMDDSEPASALWPEGELVGDVTSAALASVLANDALAGPGMRAIVVVKNGRIVGERYGDGFNADTPLLGWSMAKTVTAAIIGTLVREGRVDLDDDDIEEGWEEDERGVITIADLMAMSSGLAFNEDYGNVTDVTRMLFLTRDMATFAEDKPLAGPVGETFGYSSGTSVILSGIWQDRMDSIEEAVAWPREALFGPLGMRSAVLETDASGTFVGSSYLYATARDWVRFGQFLLQDGAWNGEQILPEGFVAMMREPAPASDGIYGKGQLWLSGPRRGAGEAAALPDDAFWLRGHDGQSVVVIPSQGLVVLRMGLTPSKLGYSPQDLVAAVVGATAN